MSQMNSQHRSNSKIFAPHASAASSRTGSKRNAGLVSTDLRGSTTEGRVRDWQPTIDKAKNGGQNLLVNTQSSRGVPGGLQMNNSSS